MRFFDFLIRIFIDQHTRERLSLQRIEPRGLPGIAHTVTGHFRHFTLYNPLALIAGITFFASIFFPWWYSVVYQHGYHIAAYAFILTHNLPAEGYEFIIETPKIAVVVLFLMLVGNLFLAFWGSTMEGTKGRIFVAVAGLFMLLYTGGFYLSLLYASSRVDVPVVGQVIIQHGVDVVVMMIFRKPYSVAIVSGAVCLLSSLFHGLLRIPLHTGKKG
ncbi:MAG TPA: hypothetical protein ENN34_08850 [Deltaproteobacteria bacterium]|nr:hypothetical protein [Deltaproteobacteria bacterium]